MPPPDFNGLVLPFTPSCGAHPVPMVAAPPRPVVRCAPGVRRCVPLEGSWERTPEALAQLLACLSAKPLREPVVDLGQELSGDILLAALLPQPCQAHHTS